jgi:hypothetical protein
LADNVTLPGTGAVIATDEVTDGTLGTVEVQYVKVMDGVLGGTAKQGVDSDGAAGVVLTGKTSATLTNVSGSATSVSVFSSSSTAKQRIVWNDSTATLYLKFGTTASVTSATVAIPPNGYYEFPQPLYRGAVDGIWSSATGTARITEM